jgi:uncharacterized protein YdhG (YjbR/CyaY superfamily)
MKEKNGASKRIAPESVDDYLAATPEVARNALEKLRKEIKSAAPKAVEVISYQIPTFKYQGRGLVAYSAHKNHCSLHVMSISVMNAHKDELKLYTTTKASIHFTAARPLPQALVKKLVKARMDENEKRSRKSVH